MRRDASLYLSDIIESMDDAVRFIEGMKYEDFLKDKKTMRAVIGCIEIIGEATKQVPEDLREKKPEVPWKNMARMRDKCMHVYFGVDYGIVWGTVTKNIPAARPMIAELLEKVRSEQKKRQE
jgi:uncharacterized protein with HEPN domain